MSHVIEEDGPQLSFSQGLAFDASGNLFIADASNRLIRKVIVDCFIELSPTPVNCPLGSLRFA